jgi:cytosine/adenosine deaminase-related metal-dependent hydrolase
MSVYRARWVLPISSPPMENGWVSCNQGVITSLGQGSVAEETIDLGNVAIIPCLINAHTHLEFSNLEAPLGTGDGSFADWIQAVLDYRASSEVSAGVIASGWEQSNASGVAAIGEIATADASSELESEYQESVGELIAYREFIGLSESRVAELLQQAEGHINAAKTKKWHAGLSPHAPYTVHGDLLSGLCSLSAAHQVPLAIHLAETLEEIELLEMSTGPLRELLDRLDVWDAAGIQSPGSIQAYLDELNTCWRASVIHGNYLDVDHRRFIGQHRDVMSVVFCPRTHAYFGHSDYPLEQMLAADVRVALGTDSRASNPDLSMIAELGFLASEFPHVSAEQLLFSATHAGAYALGLEKTVGAIVAGASTRLLVVPCDDATLDNVHQQVLENLSEFSHLQCEQM